MARKPKVTGIKEVEQNLAKESRRIGDANERGVVKAALLVRSQSQRKTPVRIGNLRNSAFVLSSSLDDPADGAGGGFKGDDAGKMGGDHAQAKVNAKGQAIIMASKGPVAVVGYSAAYALSVHENPRAGAGGNTAGADKARAGKSTKLETIHSKKGQWKFLQSALQENAARILQIIKREARTDG